MVPKEGREEEKGKESPESKKWDVNHKKCVLKQEKSTDLTTKEWEQCKSRISEMMSWSKQDKKVKQRDTWILEYRREL